MPVFFFNAKKSCLKTRLGSVDVVAPTLGEVEFVDNEVLAY